jgi:hypothetical protein
LTAGPTFLDEDVQDRRRSTYKVEDGVHVYVAVQVDVLGDHVSGL